MIHVAQAAGALAAALVGSMTVAAEATPQTRITAPVAAEIRALSSKPFSRLFVQRLSEPRAGIPSKDVRPDSARRFICGTIVVSPDPSVDPRFEVPLRDTATRFTMRQGSADRICR
jgi:hypothetical protein